MARYIDLSDKAKASVQLRAARAVDWDGSIAEIKARAEEIKASGATDHKIERRLFSLRTEYQSVLRNKRFAETGVNELHAGLRG